MRTAFLAIHRTFPGNLGKEMIPLTKDGDEERAVSYEHLLRLEKLGNREFLPEEAENMCSVAELLDGVESVEDRIERQITGRMPEVERALAQLLEQLEDQSPGRRNHAAIEAVESATEAAKARDPRKTAGYLKWLYTEGKGFTENVTSQVLTSLLRGY